MDGSVSTGYIANVPMLGSYSLTTRAFVEFFGRGGIILMASMSTW